MSQPYIGEIRMFAGNFAPQNWAFCDGSILSIAEHDTLYSLIGTTYGGDGAVTFGLPDLRGRIPLHQGSGPGLTHKSLGERSGEEYARLNASQMPLHTHMVAGYDGPANADGPAGNALAQGRNGNTNAAVAAYAKGIAAPSAAMKSGSVVSAGGQQPFSIRQPTLGISYIISLFGIYPPMS